MDDNNFWKVQSDWYSPTRLRDSPTDYHFPGDRFIPNRSLMDLDQAHSLLTCKSQEPAKSKFSEEYRKKLGENLTLDTEGRPFRMLVFRGSPKSEKKSLRLVDEMRRSDEDPLKYATNINQQRHLFTKESRILDAPKLKDDFYMNILDWGKSNVLAIALGSEVYLWNAENTKIQKLMPVNGEDDYPTSVSWSGDAKFVAVGLKCSSLQLWDADACKLVRWLKGHQKKVGITTWNDNILTSGSSDKSILNHDVRVRNSVVSRIQAHTQEICGLKWSSGGKKLASGGNDNVVYIWEPLKMNSFRSLHRFDSHCAAVKALAWCPYDPDILASGGGTFDGYIKLWNVQRGTCINSISTKAQICGLQWNKHHKEILSGHGFSRSEHQNQLCLWKYPSMSKVLELARHSSRVLHLTQSPDGLTVASARADETLRFWEVFGPPQVDNSGRSDLDSMLSLKASPIR